MASKDISEIYPAVDVQLGRGSATNQVPVWDDTLKRYVPATLPSLSDKILGETTNWIMEEADADDVTADLAKAVGNLIVRHKTNGTKRSFEA